MHHNQSNRNHRCSVESIKVLVDQASEVKWVEFRLHKVKVHTPTRLDQTDKLTPVPSLLNAKHVRDRAELVAWEKLSVFIIIYCMVLP